MPYTVMNTILKTTREQKGLRLREVANKMRIDQALISKFESGSRIPNRQQVLDLADTLDIPVQQLLAEWIKEKIKREIGNDGQYVPEIWALLERGSMPLLNEPAAPYAGFAAELERLDSLKAKLNNIRLKEYNRIEEALELEYTFESNRIEGNTLTLQETDLVVKQGLTISGKSMREHLESINHQEAILFIKELASSNSRIREGDVLALHNLILRGIDTRNAGRYRDVQVMISGSRHVPPASYLLSSMMGDFFNWLTEAEHTLHPVVLAAMAHERLVTIHPFTDGNGRTSRLLMNLILLRNGFVIANIKGDNASRMAYYKTLEQAQSGGSDSAFILLVIHQEIEALERYLRLTAGDDKIL